MTAIPAGTASAFDQLLDDGRHRRRPSFTIRLELVVEAADSVNAVGDVLDGITGRGYRLVELVVDDAIDPALTR